MFLTVTNKAETHYRSCEGGGGLLQLSLLQEKKKKKSEGAAAARNKGGGGASGGGKVPRLSGGEVGTAQRQRQRSEVRGNTGN